MSVHVGPFCCAGSATFGTWWLGIGRWRAIIRASWNEPYFSERYGYQRNVVSLFGWRLQFRVLERVTVVDDLFGEEDAT